MPFRAVLVAAVALFLHATAYAQAPTNNPTAAYKLPWTDLIRWQQVVNIADVKGASLDERVRNAQEKLTKQGGGVLYFPAGTYHFKDHIILQDGVVLRGADPRGVTDARQDGYDPPTKFEFPKYEPKLSGDGTPLDTAFKGIRLADPATASNCGVVNVALNRGHVALNDAEDHKAGRNRLVFGCVLRNAAVASAEVPSRKIGQRPWQRFTARHHPAIGVRTGENALVANNRLPPSGDDNFTQKGYVLLDPKRKPFTVEEGVTFDYDNRPGIYVNDYGIGAGGGNGPAGTPKTHPWGFRKGLLIRDNYIFCTGRCAIAFSGDGTVCAANVIRFQPGIKRWTTTGLVGVTGSGTNDNRAVQMRGYRWTVEANDYEVHRNRAAFGNYLINDGEGLMHEAHVNSAIVDSKLLNNKGNTYLSLYKAHGIDGLLIKGNTVRTPGGIEAIYVNSNYNGKYFACRNVTIADNVTSGTGIRLEGAPAEHNAIRDNRHVGPGGVIRNFANAVLVNNEGYTVETKKE